MQYAYHAIFCSPSTPGASWPGHEEPAVTELVTASEFLHSAGPSFVPDCTSTPICQKSSSGPCAVSSAGSKLCLSRRTRRRFPVHSLLIYPGSDRFSQSMTLRNVFILFPSAYIWQLRPKKRVERKTWVCRGRFELRERPGRKAELKTELLDHEDPQNSRVPGEQQTLPVCG